MIRAERRAAGLENQQIKELAKLYNLPIVDNALIIPKTEDIKKITTKIKSRINPGINGMSINANLLPKKKTSDNEIIIIYLIKLSMLLVIL